MTPEAVALLIIGALQGLESDGVISIGGWDKDVVNNVLSALANILKALPRPDDGSPNNPGLGPLNVPAGSAPDSSGSSSPPPVSGSPLGGP